jgi:hypothetical protein
LTKHPLMAPQGELEPVKTVNISGKNHPTADGMIDRAHRHLTDREYYLVGTKLTVVDTPRQDNGFTTMVHATVFVREPHTGETHSYDDIGDANVGNCSGQTGQAAPRMASTRALSRALAQALNVAEAVAEEIHNGGSGQHAIQNQANGNGGYAAAPAQQGAPANNPLAAQFPNAKPWKFTIPGGGKKDLHVLDPAVTVEDLTYWMGRGFFSKNPQTSAYDIPDPEKTAIYQAAIPLKGNGAPAAPQGGAPMQQAPNYGQQQQPQQQQYAPPVQQTQQTAYTPPVQQQPNQQYAPPQANGWKAEPKDIAAMMQQGTASGRAWPQVKELAHATFGILEPKDLPKDAFSMLLVQLGGQPLS